MDGGGGILCLHGDIVLRFSKCNAAKYRGQSPQQPQPPTDASLRSGNRFFCSKKRGKGGDAAK